MSEDLTYSWHGASRTPSKAAAHQQQQRTTGANTTPSRSSRRSGYTNLTHFNAFTRSDGVTFHVGDAVEVYEGVEFATAQVWLDPYRSYATESAQSLRRRGQGASGPSTSRLSGSDSKGFATTSTMTTTTAGGGSGSGAATATPTRRGPKGKGRMAQRQEDDEDWIVDDGLGDSVKFGIIIDLFEDEAENMRASIHWLARPRLLSYLFGKEAGTEEGLDECHPQELIYPFDPSENSLKTPVNKPSRAEDTHDVSFILDKVTVLSESSFKAAEASEGTKFNDETFFVRKALNTKAEQGQGWLYDIDWQEVYERCSASGNWELQMDSPVQKTQSGKKASSDPSGRKRAAQNGPSRPRDVQPRKGRGRPPGKASSAHKSSKRAASPTPRAEARSQKRASSVATDPSSLLDSDLEMSSSSEEEEDDDDDAAIVASDSSDGEYSEAGDDFDNVSDDHDENEAGKEDEPEPSSEDDDDVFGPRTASGRKRKTTRKSGRAGKASPAKRQRRSATSNNAPLLRPSAAMLRKQAARAERQAQRIAERQARRLQPRLPAVQRRYSGAAGDASMQSSPFGKARAVLHVGCTPDYLPCRDNEYAEIEAYLEDAIDEGIGSCIYIAGVPGTGKTATVRSVVSALQQRAQTNEIKPFRFLEVNGMKITDPVQSFSILWEFISGNRVAPRSALSHLETHFKTPNPGRDTCVVLVDELDQLVTKKQEVIYNFFNWPNQPHSRLIVLAVANTMDLPERELSNKINSRLGSNRINFTPYDKNQLIEILSSRMEGLDGVFAKEAIGLVASKVASVTGDARRALDICRRAVEKVESENAQRQVEYDRRGQSSEVAATGTTTTTTTAQAAPKPRMVTAGDIVAVHKEMTSSGLMLFVKRCGLHQRIMLLALSRVIRKVGVADEVEFGDVVRWHLDFCRQTAIQPLPTHTQLFSILQSLADMRLVTTEGAKLDYVQRVQANVRDDELELVLRKEGRFLHYLR